MPAGLRPVASLNVIPSIALAVQRARRHEETSWRNHGYVCSRHGAWHGAWCWRRVARRLTARGHEVFTPTITGLAERSHLLRGDIDLDTQLLDVVNVMKWQGLKDVVLVGHSYGGMVVSGVAEKMEKAIASFVMLDAFFPEDGQSLIDVNVPPDRVRDAILTAERSGATVMPRRRGPCST
jgi:pimeloyl-ACP methyl ester carboxylesterase